MDLGYILKHNKSCSRMPTFTCPHFPPAQLILLGSKHLLSIFNSGNVLVPLIYLKLKYDVLIFYSQEKPKAWPRREYLAGSVGSSSVSAICWRYLPLLIPTETVQNSYQRKSPSKLLLFALADPSSVTFPKDSQRNLIVIFLKQVFSELL